MKKSTDNVIKFFISIIGLVVIFSMLRELQFIFIPLIIALFLYFVFEPLNNLLAKRKVPFSIAIFSDLVLIVGLIWGISRIIVESFSRFGRELPLYEQKLNNIVRTTALSFGLNDQFFRQFDLRSLLLDFDYGGIAGEFFTTTLTFFSTVFFVLFFFIFVSTGYKRIVNVIKKRYVQNNIKSSIEEIEKTVREEGVSDEDQKPLAVRIEEVKTRQEISIERTFRSITENVQKYIATKFLISFLVGLFIGIILWLFGVDFFIVWAVLTFLFNFIPNIGSIIAVILPALMSLIQYESLGYTLIITGVMISIQASIGNILEPKLYGDRLGLNPLVILLSLLLWGYIWGIVGMFIAVPITAVFKIIMSNSRSPNLHFISELMEN